MEFVHSVRQPVKLHDRYKDELHNGGQFALITLIFGETRENQGERN